ncbi:MAG: TraB/GumN family protein [Bacteroidetes bacterium]|nr:TraB/GumN family protein [Bacteroidota bacterium]
MIKYFLTISLALAAWSNAFSQIDLDTTAYYEDDTTVEQEIPRVRKYPARLWEITGNGLKQPSYLYGTMHVSKKLAFNLGDTFYKALQSADVVALELAIDSWLSNIGRNKENYSFGFGRYRFGEYKGYEGFYKTALSFEGTELSGILSELRSEDYMSNFLLYRQGYQSPDFSEKTYVDLYIHQIGKKLNKYCTGLEDFEISRRMVSRSDWRNRELPRERRYGGSYYGYGEHPTEKAYREGDLDMIDSLEKKGADVHFLKWMLYERNKIMADKIDEIVKTKKLFAAVGCAHLPGDSGVIEFLRRKGYTLTPVYDNVGDYAFKQKQKLETTNSPVSFKKYTSHNGELSFELPGVPLDRSYGSNEDIFYADVANGAYYVLKKIHYYGKAGDLSQEKLLKQIDSALYENIPGDITARSKTTVNGFPAIDVSNRTKTGETQRHMYILMPDYLWYIKLNAAGDYAEGKEARDFFKSINLQPSKTKWNFYEPDAGGYRVYWPTTVVQNPVSFDTSTNYKGHTNLEFTDENRNYYFLKTINLPFYSSDEDTFHMHQIAENYAFYNKGKLEKISFKKINDHEAVECLIKFNKKDEYLHLMLAADGDIYYAMGVFNKDKHAPQDFLNKFTFTSFRYKYLPVKKKDPLNEVTYKRPDWSEIEHYYKIREEEKVIAHKEIVYPANSRYGYSALNEYFKDTLLSNYEYINPINLPSGESVSIALNRHGGIAPVSNFKRMEKLGFLKNGELNQKRIKFYRDSMEKIADSLYNRYNKSTYKTEDPEVVLLDTVYMRNGIAVYETRKSIKGSSVIYYDKYATGNHVNYYVSTKYDKNRGLSPIVGEIFNSVEFQEPKIRGLDSAQFGKLMVHLLSSEDSIDIFRAADYREYYSTIPKSFNDTLMQIMKKKDKNKLYGKQFTNRIERKLREDNYLPLIGFYMDKYRRGGDTSEIQAEMLQNLGKLKNSAALDSLIYWLLEETPLAPENSYNNYVYSGIIQSAYDSLKLWKPIYKKLLPLMRYKEYEDAIMSLGVTMLDSAMIDSTVFAALVGDLALAFRDDLKRKLSKAANSDNGYEYYGETSYDTYGNMDADNFDYGSSNNTLFSNSHYSHGMGMGSNFGIEESQSYEYEEEGYHLNDIRSIRQNSDYMYDYAAPAYSGYSSSSNTLYQKAKILVRFYKQDADVAKRMQRVYKLQDRAEKMQFLHLYMTHKIRIPDTMYHYYLGSNESQYGFVQLLKKHKQKDSIPKNYFEEKNLVNSFMYYRHFEKKDTVVFLGKKAVGIEGEEGNMYFYKHRNKDVKVENKADEKWLYSLIWIGEKDTLATMKHPRYYQFNSELPKKQSVKDIMAMEVSKLTYWKHSLWQPLILEDEGRRRNYGLDYMRY